MRKTIWDKEHPAHQRKIENLQKKASNCSGHRTCRDLCQLAVDRKASWEKNSCMNRSDAQRDIIDMDQQPQHMSDNHSDKQGVGEPGPRGQTQGGNVRVSVYPNTPHPVSDPNLKEELEDPVLQEVQAPTHNHGEDTRPQQHMNDNLGDKQADTETKEQQQQLNNTTTTQEQQYLNNQHSEEQQPTNSEIFAQQSTGCDREPGPRGQTQGGGVRVSVYPNTSHPVTDPNLKEGLGDLVPQEAQDLHTQEKPVSRSKHSISSQQQSTQQSTGCDREPGPRGQTQGGGVRVSVYPNTTHPVTDPNLKEGLGDPVPQEAQDLHTQEKPVSRSKHSI